MTEAPQDDLWQVAVAPGDTRMMTLEQLDAAFEAGLVSESTLIAEAGSSDWEPLYVVAGLEPPTDEQPVASAPPSVEPSTQIYSRPDAGGANEVNAKVPLPATASPRIPRPDHPRQRSATLPGPGAVGAFRPPSMTQTAAAVVAQAGTASRPPKSKAPPLPANAFAHLAKEAMAGAKAPAAPLPPTAAPIGAGPAAPADLPAPNVPSVAPGPSAAPSASAPPLASVPPLAPSSPPPAAPAPVVPPVATPSAAPPLPPNAFGHLESAAAPGMAASPLDEDPFSADPTLAATGGRRTREWLILGAAAALGLLMILHRNGALYSISSALGAQSAYLGFEGAVLGGPSVNTPRGIEQFVERLSAKPPSPAPNATSE